MAEPYSPDEGLLGLRPRRRTEQAIGYIASEGLRWTDALWTYDVRLTDGRLIRRVREQQDNIQQASPGVRSVGDKVAITRVSRTVWEISGSQIEPTTWRGPARAADDRIDLWQWRADPDDPDEQVRYVIGRIQLVPGLIQAQNRDIAAPPGTTTIVSRMVLGGAFGDGMTRSIDDDPGPLGHIVPGDPSRRLTGLRLDGVSPDGEDATCTLRLRGSRGQITAIVALSDDKAEIAAGTDATGSHTITLAPDSMTITRVPP